MPTTVSPSTCYYRDLHIQCAEDVAERKIPRGLSKLTGLLAIGTHESSMQTGQVIVQFGGGILASVLPPPEDLPATVESKMGKSFSVSS